MRTLTCLFFAILFAGFISTSAASQASYDLRSPDGRIEVRIRTVGQISYDLVLKGQAVLENSKISLDVEHKKLGVQPKVIDSKQRSYDQVVEPVVRQKFAKIRDHYNELRLNMDGGYAVVFRAYNEGMAYRFETTLPQAQVKIYGEESAFNFTSDFVVYYPQEDSFFSHNERKYLPQHLHEIAPEFLATLPAVVDVTHGAKLAIAESDVDSYPGLWLHGTGGTGLAATFPPYPLKETLTGDRDYRVTESADYIAVTAGTRSFPWRVIGFAEKDGDLLTNQIVYLLEKPSMVEDTSWIKPGKVAWDWWNFNNVYGVDFKAGVNTATYKYFIDFAAKYGLSYIILDEGWYKLGNVLQVVPEINMEELTAYAKQKNVGIILWVVWKTLDDQLIPALDQFEKWGVKGIKVDFMQRSDQVLIDYYYKVSRECAKRKMLVDFHGDQKPASMTRTWPNLISTEGVRGMEWSKWSAETEPEHNVTLPFTRMFLGPMDYTPGAMRNATKLTFAPIFGQPMALGTRCHELAMYVVYESPLQMLSDSPSNYLREPEIMEFLGPVPSEWDDTKVLDARIADYVVVARRNRKAWYVGAMNDWTARDLEIDLSFLPDGNFTMDAYQDGVNADRNASDYKKITMQVSRTTKVKLPLASGGGWAARIHQ
ncbi:MAG TPA: glycoside hydrolase family 97 protein [Candidatus Sulfotelmatobacter sp.]|jgi:alpha-glucosidase|nr:glycoside hydrolase family 97 protein [Candidatus Sulfotelmatobacter sp.]